MSTLDTCAAQPACRAALGSELANAVTAPTGAGWGASTLSTTTATGATSTYVKAVAGVAVVTVGVLATEPTANDTNIAKWHYWNQATNSRAQVLAKQRYCAAYPKDEVCLPFEGGQNNVIYYAYGTFIWQTTSFGYGKYKVGDTVEWWSYYPIVGPISAYRIERNRITFYHPNGRITERIAYLSRAGSLVYYSAEPTSVYRDYGKDFKLTRLERNDGQPDTGGYVPPLPWKDWPQEKRSIAVAALTPADWLGLITSMPEGGRLRPGDTVNAPTNIIPGQPEDEPNTPEDERLPTKASGSYTSPDPESRSLTQMEGELWKEEDIQMTEVPLPILH